MCSQNDESTRDQRTEREIARDLRAWAVGVASDIIRRYPLSTGEPGDKVLDLAKKLHAYVMGTDNATG